VSFEEVQVMTESLVQFHRDVIDEKDPAWQAVAATSPAPFARCLAALGPTLAEKPASGFLFTTGCGLAVESAKDSGYEAFSDLQARFKNLEREPVRLAELTTPGVGDA